MNRFKRIVIFTIIFMTFLLPITTIMATDINSNTTDTNNTSIDISDYNPDNISTNSESVILMDSKTGKILYSKNANTKQYPASTTKLMTAILTLENCNLNDVVTISHNAIYSIPVGYTHANLVEGEKLTVEQLLNVLLIPSANDAAVALAEHISGSVEEFATLMNNKAKELGCLDTHFVNPNGVHDDNHYSTAYDLAIIGRYAMRFSDILRIVKVSQYTLPTTNKYDKEDRIFNTTNNLINPNDEYYYQYTTGLKTGYTDKSGSCIVATATKNNVQLLAVVLGSETAEEREKDCINLFDYGFENYSYQNLIESNELIDTVQVNGATTETENLSIYTKDDINVLLKNSIDVENLEKTVEINDNLIAPISKDAVVGTVSYTIDGETYSTELIAGNDVQASDFELIIFRTLLILLIFILFILIISKLNKPRKRKGSSHSANYSKRTKSKKKSNSRKGGRYKFTQINEYL